MFFWTKGPDLSRRATDLEMIDDPAQISRKEWEQVFRELALVNRWLGGTSACLRAIVPFLSTGLKREPVLIADVGSGSGDILCSLAARSLNRHNDLHMLAIDVNPEVCRLASKQAKVWPEINVVCADVENLSFVKNRFDIILCSAFLHHFCDHKFVQIINCLRECTTRGIIINDLHRHPVAYWSIRFSLPLVFPVPQLFGTTVLFQCRRASQERNLSISWSLLDVVTFVSGGGGPFDGLLQLGNRAFRSSGFSFCFLNNPC